MSINTYTIVWNEGSSSGIIDSIKKIKLKKNKFALVDDDFDWLSQWKWSLTNNGYAVRQDPITKKAILMHRIVNNTPEGHITDHINRNKLDNRKSNLRTTTNSLNVFNTSLRSTNRSGHKGVHFDKWAGRWKAFISVDSKHKHLGRFSELRDAVKAREQAEKELLK